MTVHATVRGGAFLCVLWAVVSFAVAGCDSGAGRVEQPIILQLDVQGMHCNGCVEAIKAEALGIEGVTGVEVSLKSHTARIVMSKRGISTQVEAAVRALGYTVTVVSPDAPEPAPAAGGAAPALPSN